MGLVNWRSSVGQRFLAIVVISPAVFFCYLGFEGSLWWFAGAAVYPVVVGLLLWFLIPEDD